MSRVCSICSKSVVTGNKVSHSNRKSTRTWNVNVQKVKLVKDGKPVTAYVCTRCLRTLHKAERA